MLIELRQALFCTSITPCYAYRDETGTFSYQYYHVLLLTLAGLLSWVENAPIFKEVFGEPPS